MVDSIEVGKNYSVILKKPHDSLGIVLDLKITGTTTYEDFQRNCDYDIRGKLFTPLGIGIETYLRKVQGVTLYLCSEVSSLNPYECEEKATHVIPASIIDYSKTREYILCRNYSLTLLDIIKPVEGLGTMKEMFDEMTGSTKADSRANRIYGGVEHGVTSSFEDFLQLKEDWEVYESKRSREFEIAREAKVKSKNKYEKSLQDLYDMKRNLKNLTEIKDTQLKAIQGRVTEYNVKFVELENYRNNLESIKNIMTIMINEIRSGEIDPSELPTFDELYEQVKNE